MRSSVPPVPGSSVTVAGAGPAGLACAIHLARSGYRVTVNERAAKPGSRFRGFQVLDDYSEDAALTDRLEEWGITTPAIFHPLTRALFFTPSGRARVVASQCPYGYMIRRGGPGSLDEALARDAEEAAVRIRFNTTDHHATIRATGPRGVDGISRECHFVTDDSTRVWVLFDPERAPGGYGYLFTLGGCGTLGAAVTREFRSLGEWFHLCRDFFRSIEAIPMENRNYGHSYMNFFLRSRAEQGGRIYPGEAGGFQDFLFGLGIRQALHTGVLAARSIAEGLPFDRLWREALGRRPERSLVNRFLYEAMGAWGLERFLARAAGRDLRDHLRFWVGGTALHELLLPAIRLLWKNGGPCAHPPLPHWCRGR